MITAASIMVGSMVAHRKAWCWRSQEFYILIWRQLEKDSSRHLGGGSQSPPSQWHTSSNKAIYPNSATPWAKYIQTTTPANEQTSKRANEQTSKRANQQTSKCNSKCSSRKNHQQQRGAAATTGPLRALPFTPSTDCSLTRDKDPESTELKYLQLAEITRHIIVTCSEVASYSTPGIKTKT